MPFCFSEKDTMLDELKIVTWKWDVGLHPKKNLKFGPRHVNTLFNMLDRHLHVPFQMICITDKTDGISPLIRTLPLWPSDLPGCFRRLRMFSKEMAELIGPRFVCIDLDVVIVNDVTQIFTTPGDFVIWGEHHRKAPYCGSFFIMDAGCRSKVYDSFVLKNYPSNVRGKYPYGTDQDHICHLLYPNEKMLTVADGIYSFNFSARRWEKGGTVPASKYKKGRYEMLFFKLGGRRKQLHRPRYLGNGELPADARMVFFNGKYDPSQKEIQKDYPWVKEKWI